MKGPPTDFWGKLKNEDDGVVDWHPLIDHCADVAAVCEALLDATLLRRRLARLAGLDDLDEIQVARLCVFAAIHDIGKFNIGFQQRAPANNGRTGHLAEVLAILNPGNGYLHLTRKLFSSLSIEELAAWGSLPDGDDIFQLLVATVSHHGRPVSIEDRSRIQEWYWTPKSGLDPFAGISRLLSRTRSWFSDAWSAGGKPLPGNPEFQHAWSGLVMLADWLGSDDAQGRFPFREDGDTADRIQFARSRSRQALEYIGLDARPARFSLGPEAPGFQRIEPDPDRSPRPAQQAMLDLPVSTGGSLTVLESETGSGKTEAALIRFARLFHAGEVDGLVFALPTRTAAIQIHGRICRAIQHAFPEASQRPAVVLAVPGYLRVDQAEGQRLARFEVLWPDGIDERLRYRAWAAESSKRYLAGPIVVGTIDQVLLSALQVGHAHLRATALLRQFLVVDEVHASDAYMTRILTAVLDQHLHSGGHALLLSATLGAVARAKLLADDDRDRRADRLPGFEIALAQPYPLVSYKEVGGRVEALRIETEEPQAQKAVQIALRAWIADPAAVAREAVEQARQGAKVLVIRNTVTDCLATQEAVEQVAPDEPVLFRCSGVVAPHHGRFADEDRKALDIAIETEFGRERQSGGKVVVATQTVEQSLDLDADFMISDLCPMDVLLQRIGRLHRHSRDRPAGFGAARVVVLVPPAGDLTGWVTGESLESSHGLGTVYTDLRVLEATWRLLRPEPKLRIPAENRRLVEQSVHPDLLRSLADELGDAWKAHAQSVWGRELAEVRQADINAVRRATPFGKQGYLFVAKGERKIPTRLGLDDRLARFEPSVVTPFGGRMTELTIPHFLGTGLSAEAELAEHVAQIAGSTSFRLGSCTYSYDRLGLRRVSEG